MMEAQDTPPALPDPEALQLEITTLPGVRAARVVTSERGRITEIHVVAEGGKPAKQLVRDVQTLAVARFGIDVDHRVISVVHFGEERIGAAARVPVELVSVSWTVEGRNATCRVELACAGRAASGEARSAAATDARTRSAGSAAADALQQLVPSDAQLELLDVTLVALADRRVALVALLLATGSTEQTLVGTALVRTDETDAVARAVLDAYDRAATR